MNQQKSELKDALMSQKEYEKTVKNHAGIYSRAFPKDKSWQGYLKTSKDPKQQGVY